MQTSTPRVAPPESARPDRLEVMHTVGATGLASLAEGVAFECVAGPHCGARELTTGYARFNPRAALPYHTHPCGESITLVQGRGAVWVEGRQYVLEPFDNVTIPRDIAHSAVNLSETEQAAFHVALPTSAVTRQLVEDVFPMHIAASAPSILPELVTRSATARRFQAGPGTEFIDYFSQALLPGIEMSGGYGRFQPGGRLPAHYHDFDESICIVEGDATCVVEGRLYTLSHGAAAMVPNGRVHYFINNSQGSMTMIWVYAGPMPERLVVDESCATVAGDPWRTS